MNPRYLAYCVAHGRTPEEMLAHDAERFPGGKMAGFIVWISRQVREWRSTRRVGADLSDDEQEDLTRWILDRVGSVQGWTSSTCSRELVGRASEP